MIKYKEQKMKILQNDQYYCIVIKTSVNLVELFTFTNNGFLKILTEDEAWIYSKKFNDINTLKEISVDKLKSDNSDIEIKYMKLVVTQTIDRVY